MTAVAVGSSTVITVILNIWRDRGRARVSAQARLWDAQDRAEKNAKVMQELERNTKVSVDAFRVGNNLNEKLLNMDQKLAVAIPETERILSEMLAINSNVSPADIARVLVDMKRNADSLERYAHHSVHRLNNMIQKIQLVVEEKKAKQFHGYDSPQT